MSKTPCRGWQQLIRSALLMIGLLLAVSASIAAGRDANPRMIVPETTYDFGEVFVGQYMYHVFTIRNEGAATLTLSDDLPSKPAVRPSTPVNPANRAYTDGPQGDNGYLAALTNGEAFGVRRLVGALVTRTQVAATQLAAGARLPWDSPAAGSTPTPLAPFSPSPVPVEPEPT